MKHSQIGVSRVGAINPDGHAIGVDIGATAVRAAILSPGTNEGRPSVTVHGLGQVALPVGAVINGVVTDQAVVTAALKQLWEINRFECRNVIVGITNQQVVVRDLQIPNLPPDQLARALPFQAREIVALPIDQVLLDFVQLGEPDPETDILTGLLVATPRQPVLSAVAAVEKAGLRVARVDLSTFASLRSIADAEVSVEAVVDLGAHLTNIVIHSHGIPKVVRSIPRGAYELTQRLADDLGLSVEEAERAKWENGLNGTNKQVSKTLDMALRPLLAEIRSSIHYFASVEGTALLERVSLTGGGSALRGLTQTVADLVGLPTSVVNPMQHVRNRLANKDVQADEAEGSASAVSLGLAMGAAA
ncbi:type IV pilus assembly protein PilM [Jatrophihabitans telluris]|uniref:Type IV pilus assembly protein PilM n=1 Tax=Jatrophihabitans telluris TaxID=2038343 RepID=A0ABY4R2D8_9ACTN|nr:type IV pilus assembly protein PilM [Jatrophihabitans telluris]UQX89548.1 type IV pilus assembly protein PilM [Jatrophihabitans telluris]